MKPDSETSQGIEDVLSQIYKKIELASIQSQNLEELKSLLLSKMTRVEEEKETV